jgi:hypothetical protein
MSVIAAFDLGIKNLSYCVARFDASGALIEILRWANLNLLAGGAESQSQTRCSCGGPASWSSAAAGGGIWCKRCVNKGRGGGLTPFELTQPSLAELRTWATERATALGIGSGEAKRMTKAALLGAAAKIRLMPYKPPKAAGVSLQAILAGMETALDAELVHLAAAGRVRIENQPAEFAPHMKSVQMMLFALVDHRLRREHDWNGSIEFVHAGVKTRGAGIAAGKESKRDRKAAGIARVGELLAGIGAAGAGHLAWWSTQAKQDDLADALLMCCDGVQKLS